MTVGTVSIVWRNGEDSFCIARIGDILALEEKCKAGIMTVMRRLETDDWYVNDVRETIRLGLIGGGMAPEKAMVAVKLHVEENPNGLAPSVVLAHAILRAALIGAPEDEIVGKQPAAEDKTGQVSSETTVASAAQSSSASEPPSDGPPQTPMGAQFGSSLPAWRDTTEPIPETSRSRTP